VAGPDVLATVDGTPVFRATVMDLLMRAHGPGILDQLVGLEAARGAAARKGISIDQGDIDREYQAALRRLVDPLAWVNAQEFDQPAAEKLLETVLADRNVARDEFFITMRRNAYLRKMVQAEQSFGDAELREEHDRAYGKRVQVRHIQLGSQGDVARVTERLAAGEDFGELAARYSANSASAKRQGLLEPFCENEPDLPQAFRQAAFALRPGEVSAPVRIGAWEHLIRLEKVLEAEPVDFHAVRDELIRRRRERVTDVQVQKLADKLFQGADVRINDPLLREAFFSRHPELTESGGR
jgi:parvulin-like peptidyl-prolyl isomerase